MANKYYDTNTINDVIMTERNPFLYFWYCLLLQFYVAPLSRVSIQRLLSDRISEKKFEISMKKTTVFGRTYSFCFSFFAIRV